MKLKENVEKILATANADIAMGKIPEMVILRAVLDTIQACGEHYTLPPVLGDPNPTKKGGE